MLPDSQPIQKYIAWFSPRHTPAFRFCQSPCLFQYPQPALFTVHQYFCVRSYPVESQIRTSSFSSLFEDTTAFCIFSPGPKDGPAFGPEPFIQHSSQQWTSLISHKEFRYGSACFLAESAHCFDTIRQAKILARPLVRWTSDILLLSSVNQVYSCHQKSHDWKHTARIGEASNPGPPNSSTTYQHLSLSLINPTTIYRKEDDFLALDTDILCLAETAATKTVQMAFNQALRHTSYKTYWSAPVPDKMAKLDPTLGHSLRGDNLGTAIMTRLPSRDTRHSFPPSVWDTCRLNSVIISTGILDILVVSAYFQTGKSAEARIVNNQILHDIWLHVTTTTLPFIVAGDFNTDVRKLDAFSLFHQSACAEMFEFHRNVFGFELPPTCKGSTRYDSMIFHPFLQKYIQRIDVGPEHQFADHCVVRVLFNVPTKHTETFT